MEGQFLAIPTIYDIDHFGIADGFLDRVAYDLLSGFSQKVTVLVVDICHDAVSVHNDKAVVSHPENFIKDVFIARDALFRHTGSLLSNMELPFREIHCIIKTWGNRRFR